MQYNSPSAHTGTTQKQAASQGITNLLAASFCCCNHDLGHMTLKLDWNIDILSMYLHTNNKVARSSHSEAIA